MKAIKYIVVILIFSCCTKQNVDRFPRSKTNIFSDTILVHKLFQPPFKIICTGNSLTSGYLLTDPATTSYPAQLGTLLGGNALVLNKGIGSFTTPGMISRIGLDVTPNKGSGDTTNIVVAWEIGNEIFFNGSVDTACYHFKVYCDSVRSLGWKVLAVSNPFRWQNTWKDPPPSYAVKLNEANQWLRDSSRYFSDGLVDIALDSNLMKYNSTYYQLDETHLKPAGYSIVANAVYKIITK